MATLDDPHHHEESVTEDFGSLQAKYMMQCWSAQGDYDPIPVDYAEGCWIHTTDGRRLFDLRSAHECINLGFRHPKVLQAMRDQMERVVYVTDDFATEPTAELARTLAEITPGDPNKRVWFGQSGAAAVEAAIKAARFYKYNVLLKQGSNHTSAPGQYPYPISHKLSRSGDCQGPRLEDIFLLGLAFDNPVDFVASCEPAG